MARSESSFYLGSNTTILITKLARYFDACIFFYYYQGVRCYDITICHTLLWDRYLEVVLVSLEMARWIHHDKRYLFILPDSAAFRFWIQVIFRHFFRHPNATESTTQASFFRFILVTMWALFLSERQRLASCYPLHARDFYPCRIDEHVKESELPVFTCKAFVFTPGIIFQ